jgi:hypothetical protein
VKGHYNALVFDTAHVVESTNANETVLAPGGVPAVTDVPELHATVIDTPACNGRKRPMLALYLNNSG